MKTTTETARSSEVRVKLNITRPDSTDVKNLWMCLDYNQKPTIAHIIDHVRKHYLSLTGDMDLVKKTNTEKTSQLIKLYLDNFWLPPYENSRLLRENDCVMVNIGDFENEQPKMAPTKSVLKNTNEELSFKDKLSDKQLLADSYYHNYYAQYSQTDAHASKLQNPQAYPDYYNSYNLYKENEAKKVATTVQSSKKPAQQTVVAEKPSKPLEQATKSQETAKNKNKPQPAVSCHKKFSIGSYAHLLLEEQQPETESISGEQIIDKYYDKLKTKNNQNKEKGGNKTKPAVQQQETDLSSNAVGKIAAGINSTGKSKWKNSTKPATSESTMPKHIRFSSSDSSTSSSSSSSESSSDSSSEEEVEVKPVKMVKAPQSIKKNPYEQQQQQQQQNVNKWYEPSKENQLNAESNNRSYYIQTTKDLNDFKKVFNQSKLNAPKNEMSKSQSNSSLASTQKDTSNKKCNSHPASAEKKKQQRKKSQSPPPSPKKPDYSHHESLIGAPRVNDKLAFQILEISESFTPEISDYKTGCVLDFDSASNEVTIKLFSSKYNSVLEKPSKFSVVLDDQDEMAGLKESERNMLYNNGDNKENEDSDEEPLKADWRNLINVKLLKD